MAKSKHPKNKDKQSINLTAFKSDILDDVFALCREEALQHENDGAEDDMNGDNIGAYGNYLAGATCRYLMEKILELKINV